MGPVGLEPTSAPCKHKDLQQSIDEKARKRPVLEAKSAPGGTSAAPEITPELVKVIEA